MNNFITAIRSMTLYCLPALERLSEDSQDFTSDQQRQFITLFATGLIGFIGGLIFSYRSHGNCNSLVKSMSVSLLGATTIVTSYMLLASSFDASCPAIFILSSNGHSVY